jgi:type IV secretion system protein VirD4
VLPPKPSRQTAETQHEIASHDWVDAIVAAPAGRGGPANSGIRREPELPEHEEIAPAPRNAVKEFEPFELEPDDDAQRARTMRRQVRTLARQTALDPADDMGL